MATPTNKPKVLLAIMTGGKDPIYQLHAFVGALLGEERAEIHVKYFTHRPAEENRNRAANATVEGGFDFMIMIDPDNVPLRNPIDLVLLNLDIVGMPYPAARNVGTGLEIGFLAMDKQADGNYLDHKDRVGLKEVDAVGSGAMVVSRKVLEQVKPAFMRIWDENGYATKGIDFNFCDRAKALGFKVWAHYDYLADHIKEVSLLAVLDYSNGR